MSVGRLFVLQRHCCGVKQLKNSTTAGVSDGFLKFFQTSSNMSTQKITFPSEGSGGDCPAVMFGDVSNSKKGLIVLQEWWGMNQQIQDQGAELATMGPFVTLVPDLYRGKIAMDREEAGHYMGGLDWLGAVKDIEGAAHYLRKQGCTKVGVTGFCMGGALSLAAAAVLKPEVDAAVPFYGIPSDSLFDVQKIRIPLQCHFGDKDSAKGFSSPAEQEKLLQKLKDGGVEYEFLTYEGADHAFANKTLPNYNEKFCNLAIGRLVAFMNKHLE